MNTGRKAFVRAMYGCGGDPIDDDLADQLAEEDRTTQTPAQRQEAFRARRAMLGLSEVRGIYAHKDDHQAIKEYANRLQDKREANSLK